MKSEMKMPRDRDREVKFQNNSREFSRNKTLEEEGEEDDNNNKEDFFGFVNEFFWICQ